jgi:RNA polymerase sigma-70 factor (ECF subfamily)
VQLNNFAHLIFLKNKQKISDYSNEELLSTFIESGDAAFFGELYRRYIPLVFGLCLKYLNNRDEAHDAVMDLFETLLEKVPQYEIKIFNTWLYSVAKNHCLLKLRKEKQVSYVNLNDAFVENEDYFTLLDKPQTEEEMAALAHCMEILPDKQKISVRYFFIEEKSYADIVDLTGFTLNKVKSFIQNGKRNLKSCILKVLQLS